MIWGPPKIHHAAFPMAAGRFGRELPFVRVNYDLIVNKSCETDGPIKCIPTRFHLKYARFDKGAQFKQANMCTKSLQESKE
jgi:hypothetical protein